MQNCKEFCKDKGEIGGEDKKNSDQAPSELSGMVCDRKSFYSIFVKNQFGPDLKFTLWLQSRYPPSKKKQYIRSGQPQKPYNRQCRKICEPG
ncbi:MAG: hypothetical protein NTU98_02435 [Bacteroidetes bacterium]|nr:hypothetical protein [Bacteroidota bacterium]